MALVHTPESVEPHSQWARWSSRLDAPWTRATWIVLGLLSVAGALSLGIALAIGRQVDFDVYRMGAQHVLGQRLYNDRLPGLGLPFTYPPFAALLFWPFTLVSIRTGQLGWAMFNLVALTALIGVSLRALRPEWSKGRIWSIALVALFPVLLLSPNVGTLGYGQVNFLIALLVLVDLTVVIRVRTHTLPRGVLVGIAAALKLTPLIFIPFLVLTRQFRAAVTASASFVVCTLVAFVAAPHSSWTYWSNEVFDSKRAGNLLYMSDQNLHAALARMTQATPSPMVLDLLTVLFAAGGLALAAWAYRASSPLLGIVVRGDGTDHLAGVVAPSLRLDRAGVRVAGARIGSPPGRPVVGAGRRHPLLGRPDLVGPEPPAGLRGTAGAAAGQLVLPGGSGVFVVGGRVAVVAAPGGGP